MLRKKTHEAAHSSVFLLPYAPIILFSMHSLIEPSLLFVFFFSSQGPRVAGQEHVFCGPLDGPQPRRPHLQTGTKEKKLFLYVLYCAFQGLPSLKHCLKSTPWFLDNSNFKAASSVPVGPLLAIFSALAFTHQPTMSSHLQVGVIAEPVITEHLVRSKDEVLVGASDGVWSVLSSAKVRLYFFIKAC